MGVLWGLVNYATDPTDFAYDVVTGVSVGSINSLFIAGWPKGQEKDMVDAGTKLWRDLKNDDVWVNWKLSPVMGFVNKQGLLDNRPLLQLLKSISDGFDQLYKHITVSALNIETGQIDFFNQKNTSKEQFYKAAFSSTCIPGLFPSYEWTKEDGETSRYSDNFIVGNANPQSAIVQCRELVDDDSQITIDVLLLGNMKEFTVYPDEQKGQKKNHEKTIQNYMRGRDIRYQFSNSNGMTQWIRANPDVNWRYILQQENANSGLEQI